MKNKKIYIRCKRGLDFGLSFLGFIVLSPVFLLIAAAIKMDSKGPVFFKQKRVGIHKTHFEILKFRTMRTDTPKDMPTHLLDNPDVYITKTGKFLRKTSLDELPQIFNILKGDMSIVGPRPALWNQGDLIRERDKYGANDVLPGLTGWAQVNGRDELEILVKARLDGEYLKHMGIRMDLICFWRTVCAVLKQDGVVEGGTKEQSRQERISGYGEREAFVEKKENELKHKNILITGADSYIGMSVENWLKAENKKYRKEIYRITVLDMLNENWKNHDFSQYDVVYHVAGIAHADTGKVTEEQKKLYYRVNTDLSVAVAKKAKSAGVKQFIFMSSMIVYSGCKKKLITRDTVPKPGNFYGDSKWQADQKIRAMGDKKFKTVILRPPMIYGKGSKGNYQKLANLAGKLPLFPIIKNQRSMLYIGNLCEFVKLMIDNEEYGVFFPQNSEYVNTSELVQMIVEVKGHRIVMIPFTNSAVKLLGKIPGKLGGLAKKAFGDSAYDMKMSEYKENYRVNTLIESIRLTEGRKA